MLVVAARPVASGTHIAVTRENRSGQRSYVLIDAQNLGVVIETPDRNSFNTAIDNAQKAIDAMQVKEREDELSALLAKASSQSTVNL